MLALCVQAAVYEEFSRLIPGFKPLSDKELHLVLAASNTAAATAAAGAATAPKAANGGSADVAGGGGLQATTAPLTASEESWAILEEVQSKLQPFIEQCTGNEKILTEPLLPVLDSFSTLYRYLRYPTRVADTCHFDTDPRIRTSDQRIRILLFSSVTFKMATKKVFLLITYFLRLHLYDK